MRRTSTLAVLAAAVLALAAAAACAAPGPTEARRPAAILHDTPPDTTPKCTNGMIGSGTRC
jgi:opacity protein-like surface antigen